MSIGASTDTDFEDDITVPVGTDASYSFEVSPLDLTGCTASFITTFGTFACALSVVVEGDLSVTTFAVTVPNSSLPAAGVYTWKIQVSFPFSPPIVLQYGHGAFYVRST